MHDLETGLTGTGLLGPTDFANANDVFDNAVGVFLDGTSDGAVVKFNSIHDNNILGKYNANNGINNVNNNIGDNNATYDFAENC